MRSSFPEGNAIVYCEGAYRTTNGKTAHGLVRRTRRYRVLSVVDSSAAGQDAGTVLDGEERGIPVVVSLPDAIADANRRGLPATHLVIGLAPDGGRLSTSAYRDVAKALEMGLNVDAGLHDFLSEDEGLASLARTQGVSIRDVRKPPPREQLHFFSGKIREVQALKIAVLGTDSAVGKRTTAWLLVDALEALGISATMVGTGQTSWLQGCAHGVVMDALVNDFVAGEIEHAVWSAWQAGQPEVIVIEGQGSLLNPAYPGGFEILAAGRPDVMLVQHAPTRREYDGFAGYRIHSLGRQIEALELISDRPVVAVVINREGLAPSQLEVMRAELRQRTSLPVHDPLSDGGKGLARQVVLPLVESRRRPLSSASRRPPQVVSSV